MENKKEEFYLFHVDGYFYKKDRGTTKEDIDEFQNKLLDFLYENGYYFTGFSQIEEEE